MDAYVLPWVADVWWFSAPPLIDVSHQPEGDVPNAAQLEGSDGSDEVVQVLPARRRVVEQQRQRQRQNFVAVALEMRREAQQQGATDRQQS